MRHRRAAITIMTTKRRVGALDAAAVAAGGNGAAAFECVLHLGALVEPVTALCGEHNFCHACLAAHIARRGAEATCPSCHGLCQATVAALVINIGLRDAMAAHAATLAVHAGAAAAAAPHSLASLRPP